jgi:hypothetical protein
MRDAEGIEFSGEILRVVFFGLLAFDGHGFYFQWQRDAFGQLARRVHFADGFIQRLLALHLLVELDHPHAPLLLLHELHVSFASAQQRPED